MPLRFPLHINDFPPKLRNGVWRLWAIYDSQLAKRIKVFLDLNFWRNILDAHLRNQKGANYVELLNLLIELKGKDYIICPVSGALLEEAGKLGNEANRIMLGALMSKLSDDFGLIMNDFIYAIELEAFTRYLNSEKHNKISPNSFVWRKGMHRIMDSYPENLDNTAIQFDSYLVSANQSTTEFFSSNFNLVPIHESRRNLSNILNQNKSEHANEYRDFSELLFNEFLGIVRFVVENFPHCSSYTSILWDKSALGANELLCRFFPASYTYSSILAVYRHNRNGKYKSNDFYDAEHAAVGLGYNDLFITERGLYSKIKNELKSHHWHLRCEIAKDPDEAVRILKNLIYARFGEAY